MKELRYLSKNKRGFSVDDIKNEQFLDGSVLLIFNGYSKNDGNIKNILKIAKIKNYKNEEFYYVSIYKQHNNAKLIEKTFPVSDGILSLRDNLKKIINQLGGIRPSVMIKKEILENKELNMKIQELGTKHKIKVFIVEKKGVVIQCEGISDMYTNVQLHSIGYNEVERYKSETGKYICYDGEAKDLVDEFGPYTIYIKDIEVEI